MLTATQSHSFLEADAHLDSVTVGSLLEFLGRLDMSDRAALLEAAMELMPELVDQLSAVSADIAVSAFDLSRSQSAAAGDFSAEPIIKATRSQVQGMVGYSINPKADAVLDLDTNTIVSRLAAGSQRLVRASGRETAVINTDRDPDRRTMWARVPKSGACGFCVLLASRHASYVSEHSAGTASGKGRRLVGGTWRGQSAGSAFHDNCKCSLVQMFADDPKPAGLTLIVKQFGAVTKGVRDPQQAMRTWNRHIDAANQVAA